MIDSSASLCRLLTSSPSMFLEQGADLGKFKHFPQATGESFWEWKSKALLSKSHLTPTSSEALKPHPQACCVDLLSVGWQSILLKFMLAFIKILWGIEKSKFLASLRKTQKICPPWVHMPIFPQEVWIPMLGDWLFKRRMFATGLPTPYCPWEMQPVSSFLSSCSTVVFLKAE